ncbi:nucleotide pyrophosphatase/phosphodiesterase isoform X2 [Physcomitrium patens]|uniref:Purple acid phosphatase n=2 Tax=Physcomitrium patens TaxID=3218 RepID=A9RAY2_PHYPA|nr:nucleotide pyrophosphatase/phosphodiesterase-like isoform X2 [Physcomitrium patens]XP_024356769.1 nucleotide pyrophosphatase/phosphodiesterase-like isoform X2 [Physcomitrium patens]PNR60962.1 hypothetical protein PHYPA_003755 [Physcomitrium patens]|eukprot:XP_024356761.1 nucleotide pyrophosphatase/phosphodiesterase-like isoform X2 [Physcomitrella patens]
MGWWKLSCFATVLVCVLAICRGGEASVEVRYDEHQPLSRVSLHTARVMLDESVSISASPEILGRKGESAEYVFVSFTRSKGANASDWIGVFSPAKFSSKECLKDLKNGTTNLNNPPYLCSSPIKFKYANSGSKDYVKTGKGSLTFRLIKQRADFAFGFFSGNLSDPVLLAVSNTITFADLKAPVWPRLAMGKNWNEMTVTWTSGYGLNDAVPVVIWGPAYKKDQFTSAAITLTFTRKDMCGPPASSVGWRDPGFIHTGSLSALWPSTKYYYKVGHQFMDGNFTLGPEKSFTSAPAPGQDSLQRVIIYGDMGKAERDGSNEYNNYQPAALNTTDQLLKDLDDIDIVFHIGDITYANGYIAQWDQFTEQIEGITSRVPYMIGSGNHERDWPGSGSFFQNLDSGGECGVPAETYFHMPTRNKDKFWYAADWGQFHFCIADTEQDWRVGTEQYRFIEDCLASVNRQKQPWLIFLAHRVLGYSSGSFYATEGTFAEPESRDQLQKLWQKYKVDIAMYGHVHQYERTCPVYESQCVSSEKDYYSGTFNATIHIVTGGGGASLASFTTLNTTWSTVKDFDFGFTKLTSYNSSSLLFEYKRSRDGEVYDRFWIEREYMDVLGCDASQQNCPESLLAH